MIRVFKNHELVAELTRAGEEAERSFKARTLKNLGAPLIFVKTEMELTEEGKMKQKVVYCEEIE